MDDVFKALADPHRRELLDRLNTRNGQTLRELCLDLDMTRQAVSKHLAVLEAALLVTTVRRGREKFHYLNPAPIHEIADRWIHRYDRARVEALTDLKHALEDTDMTQPHTTTATDRPEFVYTTYIRTTPERLFAALTEPAFTRRYWNVDFETDWRPGSTMTWASRGCGDQPSRAGRAGVRPAAAAGVHVAHVHRGVGGGRRHRARRAGAHRRRAPFEGDVRARTRRPAGEAHGDPRRVRARQRGAGEDPRRVAEGRRRDQDAARDR